MSVGIAGTYNFTADQGATLDRTLTWRDSNNALVNLSGYTARMQLRTTIDAPTAAVTLTTENGKITLGGSAGTIRLQMTAAETAAAAAGGYVYDLELVSGGGVVTRLLQGTFVLRGEVTR